MTPEEQKMLDDLANRIAQAPPPAIDPEADQLIRTKIGSRPDALYVLTQTVLIQNMAIEHAQQQIQELQQRAAQNAAPQQQPGSSFLPRSTPWTVPTSPGYSAPPPPPPPAAPAYTTPPPYAPQQPYAAPQPYGAPPPQAPPSGGHSFLRTAAITAGGVAAGALAFEGIKSLFGGGYSHPQQSAFLGGGASSLIPGLAPGLAPGMAPSETVINNYYDSPSHGDRDLDDDSPRSLRDDDDDRSSLADDDSTAADDFSDDSSSLDDSSSGDDLA